jgi:hypothetical protein
MQNKKGQGLSTSTIVLIIIAVAVLVILILGFSMGWSKFLPFLQSNNVDTIRNACGVACSTGSTYDFCSVAREVNDGTNPKFKESCYNLSTKAQYALLLIDKCTTLSCTASGT